MPVMDGLTATRQIRQRPGFETLPIVAMTANAMADDREHCLAAGMNDHLAKPIDPETLWDALSRWIPAGSGRATPRRRVETGHRYDGKWLPSELSDIAGLDVASGLGRVLGKEKLYLSLLRRFAAEQGQFARRFEAARQTGRAEVAQRLVHTLKGLAGQIGADGLSEAASRLEEQIREQSDEKALQSAERQTVELLDALVAALDDALPSKRRPSGGGIGKQNALCEELLESLAADEYRSVQLLEQNGPALRAALGEEYETILHEARNFDFNNALDALLDALADSERAACRDGADG